MKKEVIAKYNGELEIGGMIIPCAVLADGTRVVSQMGVNKSLSRPEGGSKDTSRNLPRFFELKALQPFISNDLATRASHPIVYQGKGGKVNGVPAILLPEICDVWLKVRDAGVLSDKQLETAQKADVLMRGLAHIGIIALVDEATGFQKEKDEYQKILAKYIAEELQPWVKTFGEDYYFQIYRLKGWDWNRFAIDKKNHPWAVANITNRIVYEKLPDGVLGALRELNPANVKGNRDHRHFQHLTPDEGKVHLLKHLGAIVSIMETFEDGKWEEAMHKIDTRFPSKRIGQQTTLPLDFTSADKKIFSGTIKRASKPAQEESEK